METNKQTKGQHFKAKPQKTKSKQLLHLTDDDPKKNKAHLLVAVLFFWQD